MNKKTAAHIGESHQTTGYASADTVLPWRKHEARRRVRAPTIMRAETFTATAAVRRSNVVRAPSVLGILFIALLVLIIPAAFAATAPLPPPIVPADISVLPSLAGAASGGVTLQYPTANTTPTFNVTFTQTYGVAMNCTIYFDGAVQRTLANVQSSTATVTAFSAPFPIGTHTVSVSCVGGAYNGSVSQQVHIANATGGLTISPSQVMPFANISLSGTMPPSSTVNVTISGVGTPVTLSTVVPYTGALRMSYQIPLTMSPGTYAITVVALRSDGTQDNATAINGQFVVVTRNPTVQLQGNRTLVQAGTRFMVLGTQFLSWDYVTIVLSRGTTTVSTDIVTADSDGLFSFTAPGNLTPGTYTYLAQSRNPAVTGTLSFTINGTAALELPPEPPIETPIVEQPTQIPEEPFQEPVQEPIGGEIEPVAAQPEPEQPVFVPEPIPVDSEQSGFMDGGWFWWVLGVVVFMLIVGVLALFVYNGTIDVSRFGIDPSMLGRIGGHTAQKNSQDDVFTRLATGTPPPTVGAHVPDAQEQESIRVFIQQERGKGFDDLTIRGALVQKGWEKHAVDNVFDSVYKGR